MGWIPIFGTKFEKLIILILLSKKYKKTFKNVDNEWAKKAITKSLETVWAHDISLNMVYYVPVGLSKWIRYWVRSATIKLSCKGIEPLPRYLRKVHNHFYCGTSNYLTN